MSQSNVKKNFLYNLVYQALVVIIPLITSPYLTRTIGSDSLGFYTFSFTFANYFVLFILLGINNYGVREIAKVRDDKELRSKIFWEIYVFQLIMLFVVVSVYIASILLFVKEKPYLYWIQLLYVVSAGLDVNWCCFGLEKFKLTVTRNCIIKILSAVLIFVLVKDSSDLWKYTLLIAGSTLISQIVIWPFLLKSINRVKPSSVGVKRHIKPNIKLFLPVIAVSLYRLMDKLMLGIIDTKREVAFYTYAERFIEIPGVVISALGTVMLPRTSNMISSGQSEQSRKLLARSMQFAMLFSIGAACGIAAISNIFIPWYYGADFKRCALFAIWLSPVTILTSWNNVIRTQFVIPTHRDSVYLTTVSVGAVVNVVMNLILIPFLDGIGAVIGTIIAQLMVCITQYLLTRKALSYQPFKTDTIAFSILGIAMMCVVYTFPAISNSVVVTIGVKTLVGIILYGSLSLFYLLKIRKDRSLVNSVVHIFVRNK